MVTIFATLSYITFLAHAFSQPCNDYKCVNPQMMVLITVVTCLVEFAIPLKKDWTEKRKEKINEREQERRREC